MSVEAHQSVVEMNPYDAVNGVDESLIDQIWHDLDEQLPRKRVHHVVTEVAQGFDNATVKTFLPILVHRRALERLKQELSEINFQDSRLLDEQP